MVTLWKRTDSPRRDIAQLLEQSELGRKWIADADAEAAAGEKARFDASNERIRAARASFARASVAVGKRWSAGEARFKKAKAELEAANREWNEADRERRQLAIQLDRAVGAALAERGEYLPEPVREAIEQVAALLDGLRRSHVQSETSPLVDGNHVLVASNLFTYRARLKAATMASAMLQGLAQEPSDDYQLAVNEILSTIPPGADGTTWDVESPMEEGKTVVERYARGELPA